MMGHKLEVKNLYKKYARREVVNDVSFSVKGGEIVGLLGPNGAGKTTCFYITCGLVRSSKGEVNLDNKSIGNMPMHKRANLGLGYLPQEPSIFRKLSVEDNILAVLEMNKSVSAKDVSEKIWRILGLNPRFFHNSALESPGFSRLYPWIFQSSPLSGVPKVGVRERGVEFLTIVT